MYVHVICYFKVSINLQFSSWLIGWYKTHKFNTITIDLPKLLFIQNVNFRKQHHIHKPFPFPWMSIIKFLITNSPITDVLESIKYARDSVLQLPTTTGTLFSFCEFKFYLSSLAITKPYFSAPVKDINHLFYIPAQVSSYN